MNSFETFWDRITFWFNFDVIGLILTLCIGQHVSAHVLQDITDFSSTRVVYDNQSLYWMTEREQHTEKLQMEKTLLHSESHCIYSTLCKKIYAFLKQPIGLQFPTLVKGDLYSKGWTWVKIPTHTYTQLIAEDHWKSSGSARMKITSLSSDDPSAL